MKKTNKEIIKNRLFKKSADVLLAIDGKKAAWAIAKEIGMTTKHCYVIVEKFNKLKLVLKRPLRLTRQGKIYQEKLRKLHDSALINVKD